MKFAHTSPTVLAHSVLLVSPRMASHPTLKGERIAGRHGKLVVAGKGKISVPADGTGVRRMPTCDHKAARRWLLGCIAGACFAVIAAGTFVSL